MLFELLDIGEQRILFARRLRRRARGKRQVAHLGRTERDIQKPRSKRHHHHQPHRHPTAAGSRLTLGLGISGGEGEDAAFDLELGGAGCLGVDQAALMVAVQLVELVLVDGEVERIAIGGSLTPKEGQCQQKNRERAQEEEENEMHHVGSEPSRPSRRSSLACSSADSSSTGAEAGALRRRRM